MNRLLSLASFCLAPLGELAAYVARERRRRPPRGQVRLSIPVISVGNLVAGGTGKTPTTAALVEALRARGKRVGVVMGGYKARRREKWQPVSDGKNLLADAETAGDEAIMFARAHPDVPLAVGRRKAEVARHLATTFPLDGLILDDGFQHRRLARDLDIVLLDARSPFGNGRVIPAGWLREPPNALRDADLIILTHANRVSDLARVRTEVATYAPDAPIVESSHGAHRLRVGGTRQALPMAALHGREVVAVCGIGSPGEFAEILRERGATVRLKAFGDHHRYTTRDWRMLAKMAQKFPIVTTAKDEVKWLGKARFPFWVLDVRVEWSPKEVVLAALDGLFSG